jgi:hypothetical protein
MKSLYDKIKQAISREKVVFSLHADNRLRERGVVRWQVVEGFALGELVGSHPANQPDPKILVRQTLADGSEVMAVWAFVESIRSAKLITVYFEERR